MPTRDVIVRQWEDTEAALGELSVTKRAALITVLDPDGTGVRHTMPIHDALRIASYLLEGVALVERGRSERSMIRMGEWTDIYEHRGEVYTMPARIHLALTGGDGREAENRLTVLEARQCAHIITQAVADAIRN